MCYWKYCSTIYIGVTRCSQYFYVFFSLLQKRKNRNEMQSLGEFLVDCTATNDLTGLLHCNQRPNSQTKFYVSESIGSRPVDSFTFSPYFPEKKQKIIFFFLENKERRQQSSNEKTPIRKTFFFHTKSKPVLQDIRTYHKWKMKDVRWGNGGRSQPKRVKSILVPRLDAKMGKIKRWDDKTIKRVKGVKLVLY